MMLGFWPVNDKCLNCGKPVDPKHDRQEIAFDGKDQCRRRCGSCIEKLDRMMISNTTGHYDPNLHGARQ